MHSGRDVTEPSPGRARWRAAARGDGAVGHDPFALLGLPARPGLSDDDVRAAWRRIAAATHPDREDGGDPARFGAAAAAYVMLRTGFGRGEALADLALGAATEHRGRHAHRRRPSADAAASGAGRHRARRRHRAHRRQPVGRWTGARLPGLTRLRGWIARRASAHDLPDAPKRGPAGTAGRVSGTGTSQAPGERNAYGSGDTTPQAPGERNAYGSGDTTRQAPGAQNAYRTGKGAAYGPGARTVSWWPVTWRPVTWRLSGRPEGRPGGLAVRVAVAGAVCVVAVVISGWSPGVVGVLAGAVTWLVATARQVLGRRRSQ
jgi:curved DNA-binding protein CbpA